MVLEQETMLSRMDINTKKLRSSRMVREALSSGDAVGERLVL